MRSGALDENETRVFRPNYVCSWRNVALGSCVGTCWNWAAGGDVVAFDNVIQAEAGAPN